MIEFVARVLVGFGLSPFLAIGYPLDGHLCRHRIFVLLHFLFGEGAV